MKIIHTSDLHLASALTSRLPSSRVASRKRELMGNLSRLIKRAEELSVSAVIIAGDLFDSERITRREMDSVLSAIEGARGISFLYLPGNHERDVIISSGYTLPENLFIFGKEWTYKRFGDVVIAGRSETDENMFSELEFSDTDKNIAVLHGELRDRSKAGGVIGIRDAEGRFIDYLALGHYHTYSSTPVDRRAVAVYCGAIEGRGFDEIGDMGFSLIDTDGAVTHSFVPFARRRLLTVNVDISGAMRALEVEGRILNAVSGIGEENLIRINLIGKRELTLAFDTLLICEKLKERFYYAEIKDSSRLVTRAEDFVNDKSLKGEFIRLCLSDSSLSDQQKQKIIHCALSALGGEAFDE